MEWNRKNKFEEESDSQDFDGSETKNNFQRNSKIPDLLLFPNSEISDNSSHSDDVILTSLGSPQLRKKHPISSTFFTRISPVVSSRKVFYVSPFKNQSTNSCNTNTISKNKNSINNDNSNDNDHNNNKNDYKDITKRYQEDKETVKEMIMEEGGSSEKKKIIRDVNSSVDENLIIKFRLIFLGVTKNDYIKQIHSGRLPRCVRSFARLSVTYFVLVYTEK